MTDLRDPVEITVTLPVDVVKAALGKDLYKFFMDEITRRDQRIADLESSAAAIQRLRDGYDRPDANESNRRLANYIDDKSKEPDDGNAD